MASLKSLLGAIDRLDGAITAFGCVMGELSNDPERDDFMEVAAIKWFFEVFRQEADDIRDHVKLLDEALKAREPAPPPTKSTED